MKPTRITPQTENALVFLADRLGKLAATYRGNAEIEFLIAIAANVRQRFTLEQRQTARTARLQPVCNDLSDDPSEMILRETPPAKDKSLSQLTKGVNPAKVPASANGPRRQ